MKAILVFETDDDISKLYADIYKEDEKGNGEIVLSYLPLRPMPEKKTPKREWIKDTESWFYGAEFGWNECIEELESDL